jgi:peptidyl-prolyl cis-trans isomerase D
MLKIFRDNLKYLSWILWLVIAIFIVFVFVDFGGGLSGTGSGRAAAATVGNREISYRDFEREYRRLENQYRQAFGEQFTPELADQMKLPLQALERLVDEQLLLTEAERLGLSASDAEVQEAILGIPGLKDSAGSFVGHDTYEQFLRMNGLNSREFEDSVRQELVLGKLQAIVASSVDIADSDVEKSYREQAERAAIRYLQLPSSRYQAEVQNLGQTELAAYFDSHREEFRLPEQRVIDYLLVDSVKLRAKLNFEPGELDRYYREHSADFAEQEQVRARHILLKVDDKRSAIQAERELANVRQRLDQGAEFEKLAAELSEDPGSKVRGGDLGYFARGRMIKEFEEAAFGAEPNSIVGPVRTAFGYHLIQVLDKRAGGERPYAEVEPQVRARLAAERADGEAEKKANELAARIEAEKLESEEQWKALADGDTVTFLTTPAFGQEDVVAGVGRGTAFSSSAFALESGKVSPPVKTPRGFAILRVKEVKAPRLPELADVEAKVRASLTRERMIDRAFAELQRARGELAGGQTIDEVAKSFGLEARDSGEFGATGTVPGLGAVPELARLAMSLGQGQIGGPVRTPAGAVLFVVTERKAFDAAAFATEKSATRTNLERSEVNRLLGSLLDQKKREQKVNYDRPLLEQFGLLGQGAGKTS